jgi:hypothetical protein
MVETQSVRRTERIYRLRVIGKLSLPACEFQDWFTPWQPLEGLSAEENEALLDYLRCFYFGE